MRSGGTAVGVQVSGDHQGLSEHGTRAGRRAVGKVGPLFPETDGQCRQENHHDRPQGESPDDPQRQEQSDQGRHNGYGGGGSDQLGIRPCW